LGWKQVLVSIILANNFWRFMIDIAGLEEENFVAHANAN
jgi:hypothetical protein